MAGAELIPLPTTLDTRMLALGTGLLKRVLSTLVLLPVFLAIVLLGPVWLFGATVVLIGAAGQWEFTGMFERAGIRPFRRMGLLGGLAVTASFALPLSEGLGLTATLLVVLAAALWRPRVRRLRGSRWRSRSSVSAT